ncbi:MAG: ACP S-malonyltransferase [Pseudomonadota bacterium]
MPTEAWVFPGQGAHGPDMLAPFEHVSGHAARYAKVCDLLGDDPLIAARADAEVLNRNRVSSLLTVTASLSAIEMQSEPPAAVAGYSIGQWTALHAAGAVTEDALLVIVDERARAMDAALAAQPPSGMLAVIGVALPEVEALCEAARAVGDRVAVSNINAHAQLTLSGELGALDRIERALREKTPKRLARVPVAGAWHGDFMDPAMASFAAALDTYDMAPLRCPVIDNVTGRQMPPEPTTQHLASQVAHPVQWAPGVETLRDLGITHFTELGYGDVLTKFGFFIDRSLTHRAVAPPPRARKRVRS